MMRSGMPAFCALLMLLLPACGADTPAGVLYIVSFGRGVILQVHGLLSAPANLRIIR